MRWEIDVYRTFTGFVFAITFVIVIGVAYVDDNTEIMHELAHFYEELEKVEARAESFKTQILDG